MHLLRIDFDVISEICVKTIEKKENIENNNIIFIKGKSSQSDLN